MTGERKYKCAVLLPAGYEVASKLRTGIHQFVDERPALDVVEVPLRDDDADPLPADGWDFDGAILWTSRLSQWVRRLADRGVRAVNCNRDWRGQPGVVSVGIDVAAMCGMVVDHLTAGRRVRQVAVVGVGLGQRPHTAEKCHGVLAAAASRGLGTALHELAEPHPERARRRVTEVAAEPGLLAFLSGLARPAGVWCETDHVARMVCNAAAHLGLAVPDQLAVLGSGDHRIALAGEPTISTLPQRAEPAGHAAAAALYGWLSAGGGPQPPDVVLPPIAVVARQSTGAVDRVTRAVDEARRIIEADACAGLTVEALCQRLDLSKVTLTARFTALLGVPPGAYIRRAKVAEAKRLLRESRLPVGQIGSAIGLSDHSKFSKFFKREVGRSPAAFRKAGESAGD